MYLIRGTRAQSNNAKKSARVHSTLSISSFHSVCVHAARTAARSAQQIIDKVKEKITRVHLLTNLFISRGKDIIYHSKQLGSSNSHGETIWLMVTEEIVLIRQSK